MPRVRGVVEKAREKLHRSSRIGAGLGTAPTRNPTTTVSPSYGFSWSWVNVAVSPWSPLDWQGRFEPCGPAKHAIFVRLTGALTFTVASWIGADHSVPMAFQYSSSWSAKPFRAPSTR